MSASQEDDYFGIGEDCWLPRKPRTVVLTRNCDRLRRVSVDLLMTIAEVEDENINADSLKEIRGAVLQFAGQLDSSAQNETT